MVGKENIGGLPYVMCGSGGTWGPCRGVISTLYGSQDLLHSHFILKHFKGGSTHRTGDGLISTRLLASAVLVSDFLMTSTVLVNQLSAVMEQYWSSINGLP